MIDSSKAKVCAEKVCAAISELGFKNRGVKNSTSLYFLRKTKALAMLIECCFVDDKDDVVLYDYKSVAEAIVYGITGQRYEEPTNDERDDEVSLPGAGTAAGDQSALYRVQTGAYRNINSAKELAAKLKAAGFDAAVVKA